MELSMQFLCILLILNISSHFILSKEIKLRCQTDRVFNLLAYDCADMKLHEIPKNLKSSTEVINASENRIRKLTTDSFSNYRDLKYIYLFNNMIIRIDPGTFEYLDRLEVLDLSINSLRKVPVELTELPHLRRLYLSDNDLRNEGLETMEKQIRSPLQILDISYNDIERIPRFGMMPLLETLNVTGNPLTQISPEQFAPFCVLKKVDAKGTMFGSCTCHNINIFVEDEMNLSPILDCKGNFKNCKVDKNTTRLNKTYITCTNEIKQELLESVKPKVVLFEVPKVAWPIPVFFAVILFLFLSMLFAHCMQKPSQRPTNQTGTSNQQSINVHRNQVYEMEQPPFRVNPGSRSTLIW